MAQSTLVSETTKAEIELSSAEKQLKEGIQQFESARDEAYKQASLDGIITADLVSNILTAENFAMPAGYVNDDIIVKVGGSQSNSDVEKTLSYVEKNGNNYVFELTLRNIQGDGELTLEIPASSIKDTAGNSNIDTNLSIKVGTENLIVDSILLHKNKRFSCFTHLKKQILYEFYNVFLCIGF